MNKEELKKRTKAFALRVMSLVDCCEAPECPRGSGESALWLEKSDILNDNLPPVGLGP
jgi:hypothetical protein